MDGCGLNGKQNEVSLNSSYIQCLPRMGQSQEGKYFPTDLEVYEDYLLAF